MCIITFEQQFILEMSASRRLFSTQWGGKFFINILLSISITFILLGHLTDFMRIPVKYYTAIAVFQNLDIDFHENFIGEIS